MTTAYTPILKLALPVTGELDGTWGDITNQQITSMVEQAVAGLATINTWTTNSHTLTTANGTTSESRCAMLVIDDDGAGNPSAAATVICPTATKSYIVRNLCGQTVTVKTSAGTGVAVPNNQAALVFCDGTNVVTGAFNGDVVGPASATDNAIARFDLTTGKLIQNSGVTIDDSNNVSGVVQLNATTLDTTNIEVTNLKAKDGTAAGSIADATGVVTLASSVLTTADINGGTIDATSIGAATAAAGSFTNLSVSGTTSFDGSEGTNGQVLTSAGTGNTPTWTTPTVGTVTSVAATAGTGISVSGSPITSSGTLTITNTAPDQTVSLTAGSGISTSGTYPNFTITNTSPSSGGTVTSVTGTVPVVSSGGATPAISMAAATTSVDGYLTSTDWNTFNNKTSNTGTVTSVGGTGTVNGLSLSGTVTTSGSLTLGGALSGVSLTTQVSGTLPVANGGTGVTSSTGSGSTVLSTSPTLTTPILGTPASGTLSNCTVDGTDSVGFRNIPQNSQSASYTLVLADSGKHIFHPSADTTARTYTIPANSSVSYPLGTAVIFINQIGAGVITISITSDTLRLAGSGTTGNRTLAANGVATAIKVTTTEWIISGVGLT